MRAWQEYIVTILFVNNFPEKVLVLCPVRSFEHGLGGMIGCLGNKKEIVSSNHSNYLSLSLFPPPTSSTLQNSDHDQTEFPETQHISSCVLNSDIHVWYCNTVSHSGIWQLKFLR
jgi:hypothetical protein